MKLELLFPTKEYLNYVLPVTSTSTTISGGLEISEDGLFSTKIFGAVGSEERLDRFSYIDLNVNVIHPRIYRNIRKMSSLYRDIIDSKVKVIFEKGKYKVDPSGETGIGFFIKNIFDLIAETTESAERINMLKGFNKYRDKGLLLNKYLIVIPAGMRDFEVSDDGRITMDEINDAYRKVITDANMLKVGSIKNNDIYILRLQNRLEELTNEIYLRLKGKKGFIGKNISGRKVDYETTNVISGKSRVIEDLEDGEEDAMSEAGIGILQYAKNIEPISKYMIKHKFGLKIMDIQDSTATVYSNKLELSKVTVNDIIMKRWTDSKGLGSLLNRFRDYYFRDYDVVINHNKEEHYPFLFKVLSPNDMEMYIGLDVGVENKELKLYTKDYPSTYPYFRPIKYGEMLTIALNDTFGDAYGTITRHPIADQASIPIVKFRVDTTTEEIKVNIKEMSPIVTTTYKVDNFPKMDATWNEALNPSYSLLKAMGADLDGDALGSGIAMTKESKEELKEVLNSLSSYLRPNGLPLKESSDHISEILMLTMTK